MTPYVPEQGGAEFCISKTLRLLIRSVSVLQLEEALGQLAESDALVRVTAVYSPEQPPGCMRRQVTKKYRSDSTRRRSRDTS